MKLSAHMMVWGGAITLATGVVATGIAAAVLGPDLEVARRFEPVPGQLLGVEAVEDKAHGGRFNWRVEVSYRYVVAGLTHTGQALEPVQTWYSSRRAEANVRQIQTEPHPRIWVDPARPTRAFLRHALQDGYGVWLGATAGPVAAGLLMLVAAWRKAAGAQG